jgi:hypothetical protein
MHWFPQTKLGKVSFWLGVSGLVVIILLNVVGEMAFCSICPEGYRKDGSACNPECYYSTPPCLMPSTEPVCNMDLVESSLWRTFDIIMGLLAMACILASGITSVISIIKYHERAILIFVPAALGVIGLIFVLGEFLIPH